MSRAEKLAGRHIVASVSGGKDSAAMSLWLQEQGYEHERVFCDTGWESDVTLDYLRDVLPRFLGPIKWLVPKLQMEPLVDSKAMFPSRTIRYCTQQLKVFPTRDHLLSSYQDGAKIANAVGIRAAESAARAKFPEWEPWPPGMAGIDVEVWRPLLLWTEQDVIDIHKRHGLPPNPLYLRGASRVGCWPCIFARKEEIALVAKLDPARIDRLRDMEERVGTAMRARHEARGEVLADRPAWFQSDKKDEATGRYPMVPIDDAVTWARTTRGGKQLALFDAAPRDEGCMRWGMCEAAT